jgi:hypothetical protein
MGLVETGLEGIENLYNAVEKLVRVYEKIEEKTAKK